MNSTRMTLQFFLVILLLLLLGTVTLVYFMGSAGGSDDAITSTESETVHILWWNGNFVENTLWLVLSNIIHNHSFKIQYRATSRACIVVINNNALHEELFSSFCS
jgi:hypothetical protein